MNILVIGATGRVGKKLVNQLSLKGHTIYAGSRNPSLINTTKKIIPIQFDLKEDIKINALKMKLIDAVYFVAGSRSTDLFQSDLFGSVKAMQSAEEAGVNRFIHLSGIFATEPEKWNPNMSSSMKDYYIAKFFSDRWLIDNTNLEYTILQPGTLTEEDGSGLVEFDIKEYGNNSIDDVVAVLVEVLEKENTYKKIISMHQGNTPVAEAVNNV